MNLAQLTATCLGSTFAHITNMDFVSNCEDPKGLTGTATLTGRLQAGALKRA
jgi:hypothetical protein